VAELGSGCAVAGRGRGGKSSKSAVASPSDRGSAAISDREMAAELEGDDGTEKDSESGASKLKSSVAGADVAVTGWAGTSGGAATGETALRVESKDTAESSEDERVSSNVTA
jgi:hypothetical protein